MTLLLAFPAAALADVPKNVHLPDLYTNQGVVRVGEQVGASSGGWDAGPEAARLAYQWLLCDASGDGCAPIAGATDGIYTAQPSDLGHTLRMSVVATNSSGSSEPALSLPSPAVQAALPPVLLPTYHVPANQSLPKISGTAKVGSTVTVSQGTWSGDPPLTYAYQWYRCHPHCEPIPGATAQTYTLTAADADASGFLKTAVVVLVSATNQFRASAYSNPIVPAPRLSEAQALRAAAHPAGLSRSRLRRDGGYAVTFVPTAPGVLEITLTKGRTVVARLRKASASGGTVKGTVKLTKAGRRILRRPGRVKLKLTASFNNTEIRQTLSF